MQPNENEITGLRQEADKQERITDMEERTVATKASKSELIERLGAEPFDKEAYLKFIEPLQADTLRLMVADLTDALKRMETVIKDIAEMTDPDDPESYRADDREGCFDTVFYKASTALKHSP